MSAVSRGRLCDSRMALLKRKEEGSASLPTLGMLEGSSLTELQLRKANKAVLEIAESKEPKKRGKYNQYTPEQLIYD